MDITRCFVFLMFEFWNCQIPVRQKDKALDNAFFVKKRLPPNRFSTLAFSFVKRDAAKITRNFDLEKKTAKKIERTSRRTLLTTYN